MPRLRLIAANSNPAQLVVARLVTGELIEYFALDDDFVLIEMFVPANLAGKKLGDTDIRPR